MSGFIAELQKQIKSKGNTEAFEELIADSIEECCKEMSFYKLPIENLANIIEKCKPMPTELAYEIIGKIALQHGNKACTVLRGLKVDESASLNDICNVIGAITGSQICKLLSDQSKVGTSSNFGWQLEIQTRDQEIQRLIAKLSNAPKKEDMDRKDAEIRKLQEQLKSIPKKEDLLEREKEYSKVCAQLANCPKKEDLERRDAEIASLRTKLANAESQLSKLKTVHKEKELNDQLNQELDTFTIEVDDDATQLKRPMAMLQFSDPDQCIAHFEKRFDKLDAKKTGSIDSKVFHVLYCEIEDKNVSMEESDAVFNGMTQGLSSAIPKSKFIGFVKAIINNDNKEVYQHVFTAFDEDHCRSLDMGQFMKCSRIFEWGFSTSTVQNFVGHFTGKKDGVISLDLFMQMIYGQDPGHWEEPKQGKSKACLLV
ncbi:hypothetical protein TVAG_424050 [Trichomonas vaginalis G3]|uniref:EF hand family protein n=1 Tax=Trichomonas vaginalis (strain ATCC PRA-98 / G3) TaxID=412133 RepID=A2E1P5_TRIV3|nr:calcium-binding protein family [Trichomonas vaginalis G3]EAY13374.1 hypothetical protein TVAG_424050 [Trichomonas vaginalis G3]KAI5528127.1 calcium-binding protein family [Trichomonas vaginalis G3]|eukprot:XP_001325597.1 hypothetical protein [Trichomonas vaginalis G3]